MTRRLVLVAWLGTATAAGCGRDRAQEGDSAMAADSTRFGDDRASQGDSARTVADVALLERLVDQYEGLDVVMDELAGPGTGRPVQGRAWKADRHEDAAKDRLLELLRTEFGERYHPKTPEGAVKQTDSIASLPRGEGTRALNALVLDHHRRVAGEITRVLPTLRSQRVREVLTELHESLAKEIEKLGGPAM